MMYQDYLSRTGKPLTPGRYRLEIYDDDKDSKNVMNVSLGIMRVWNISFVGYYGFSYRIFP